MLSHANREDRVAWRGGCDGATTLPPCARPRWSGSCSAGTAASRRPATCVRGGGGKSLAAGPARRVCQGFCGHALAHSRPWGPKRPNIQCLTRAPSWEVVKAPRRLRPGGPQGGKGPAAAARAAAVTSVRLHIADSPPHHVPFVARTGPGMVGPAAVLSPKIVGSPRPPPAPRLVATVAQADPVPALSGAAGQGKNGGLPRGSCGADTSVAPLRLLCHPRLAEVSRSQRSRWTNQVRLPGGTTPFVGGGRAGSQLRTKGKVV